MVSGLLDDVTKGQADGLERDLRGRVDGEFRFDPGTRGAYSTDASNFRQVPAGVVLPRTPEPATPMNCTLGGMIGNNSCGATAQRTGKVVDNIAALEVLLYDGTRFWCGPTADEEYARVERRGDRRAEIYRRLRRLRKEYADLIRERYPEIPRRVSGYNLDSLLPEHGFDIAGLLVGSESTLVTVQQVLLPRLRDARPGAVVVADGFSCRTQIHELDSGGREAVHLAAERPETAAAPRPAAPSRAAAIAVTAGILAAAAAGAVAAFRAARR